MWLWLAVASWPVLPKAPKLKAQRRSLGTEHALRGDTGHFLAFHQMEKHFLETYCLKKSFNQHI